jgi:hypothetical protein
MFDIKALFGVLAIVFTILTILPYIRGIRRGETKPHMFTWLIWTLTMGILAAAQMSDEAGPGAWAMTIGAVLNFVVFLSAIKQGEKNITLSDWVTFLIALLALPLWFFTHDPLWSVILLTSIDGLGYVPTFRKSWAKPQEEVILTYIFSGSWQILSLFAIVNYSWVTVLAPATFTMISAVLVIYLFLRRRALGV